MKKLLISLCSLPILFLLLFSLSTKPVYAAETFFDSNDSEKIVIEKNIDDDVYIASENSVYIKGNITGDVYVASGQVDIDGYIFGNVYAAGGYININGDVNKSVNVAAGQLTVKGNIGRDLNVAAGTVKIDGNVKEDVLIASGNVWIYGKIGDDLRGSCGTIEIADVDGDIYFSAGQFTLNGDVDGDVYLSAGTAKIKSKNIQGDLMFWGEKEGLDISSNTVIKGKNEIKVNLQPVLENTYKYTFTDFVDDLVLKLIITIALGIGYFLICYLLIKFAPVKTKSTINELTGRMNIAKSFLVGFVAFPVGLSLGISLLLSVVGIPVLIFLVALYGVYLTLIVPISAMMLGLKIQRMTKNKESYITASIFGVVILQVLRIIPIFGDILNIVLSLVVLGALIRMQFFKYKSVTALKKVEKEEKVVKTKTKK